MRKQTFTKAILAVMTGTVVMSACVDDKYDLSNLDTTIQVGSSGTLKLPQCSTGDIVLDNLFNLADNGPIKKITGSDGQELYYLDKDGEANPDPIKINQIKLNKPADQTFAASIDLRIPGSGVKAASRRNEPSEPSYIYDISESAKADLLDADATGISTDVLDISRISITPTTVTLKITLSGKNTDIVKQIHFDALTLKMPTGLEISQCTYQGVEKPTDRATNEGVIVLNEAIDEAGLPLSKGLTFTLTLNAAQLKEGAGISFNPATHSAHLNGHFALTGYARLSASDIDVEKLITHLYEELSGMTPLEIAAEVEKVKQGNYQDALNRVLPQLNFNGSCKFDRDLTVQTFSGALQHPIDKIDDIKLDNLPNFLTDDGVTLDLSNPQLYLDFYTDLQTQINTDISLLPKFGQKTETGVAISIDYDGNNADKGKHKVFMLAPHPNDVAFPEMYKTFSQERQTAPVGNLIRKIPDVIKVAGQNGSQQIMVQLPNCDNIEINRSYNVELRYRIFSPLTFGNDFQIVYRDSEKDLKLGDDLDDLNVESLTLTGVAHSDIPLSLNLNVKPLNKQGVDLSSNLLIEYKNSGDADFQRTGVKIRGRAAGAEQDKFSIRIRAAQGHTLNEFLHTGATQLDGIEYVAKLNEPSSNADALNTAAKVWLTNIQASVTGVSYLANKDDD